MGSNLQDFHRPHPRRARDQSSAQRVPPAEAAKPAVITIGRHPLVHRYVKSDASAVRTVERSKRGRLRSKAVRSRERATNHERRPAEPRSMRWSRSTGPTCRASSAQQQRSSTTKEQGEMPCRRRPCEPTGAGSGHGRTTRHSTAEPSGRPPGRIWPWSACAMTAEARSTS